MKEMNFREIGREREREKDRKLKKERAGEIEKETRG